VDNWLQDNQGMTGTALTDAAQQQGFDPAFIALVNFPQVLEMMAQHVDDYAAIGQAFSAGQEAVSASVQRLRAQAYAAGTLRSTSQQQVVVQQPAGQTVYVIQPASPQVVYVPQYDPAVVYVAPSTDAVVVASLISFGVGIGIEALLVDNRPWGWSGWGWNWGSRRVYYNHIVWGGWSNPYRPPRPWYRPRPVVWSVPATIGRLTDRVTHRVTTGLEIVPVATGRQPNHPDLELRVGRQCNPLGPELQAGQCNLPDRARRIVRAKAGLRGLVKPDRHIRINLAPINQVRRGQPLSQSLEERAVHRRSRGNVSNQGRRPDRRKVNRSKGTSEWETGAIPVKCGTEYAHVREARS
jgi:hypothetical protein